MKYFTEAYITGVKSRLNSILKGFFVIILCSLVSFNINAQCGFTTPSMSITRVISPNDSLSKVDSIIIGNQLSPDGGLCELYWVNPNNPTDTSVFSMMDTIHVYCPSASVVVKGDSIFSGTVVTFLVGETMAGPFAELAKVDVTFAVTDNTAPIFTVPSDTIINCQSDTSIALLGVVTNIIESCSGVQDTLYVDSLIQSGPSITMDTIQQIMRIWTVIDNSNNMASDTQLITIIDTFPPVWDTVQVSQLSLQNDTIYWNGSDTLKVVIDTSGVIGTNNSYFWTHTFKPSAVDSCFGIADTLGTSNVSIIDIDTTFLNCEMVTGSGASAIANNAVFLIERKFNAVDGVMNLLGDMDATTPIDSGSFVLQIFFIDTLPPVVIDTPLLGSSVTIIKEFIEGGLIDTFVVDNTTDTCGILIMASDIMITARDSFSKDSVLYNWKVETLMGNATLITDVGGFATSNDTASQFYPVGMHKITYIFRDSTGCNNEDSLQFVLIVRDTQNIRIDYTSTTFINNPATPLPIRVDTVVVDATINGCTEALNWIEPSGANLVNCTGMPLPMVSIERKFISGPDPTIFDGFPSIPAGNSVAGIFPVGTTIFQYVFEEQFGVKDSFQIEVTVLDKQKPNAVCQNFTLLLDIDGKDTVSVADINGGSTDNCGIDTMYLNRSIFDCDDIDTPANIWLIVRDFSGNVDSCMATVTVDFIPIPLADTLVADTAYCEEIIIYAPLAIDNCVDTIYGRPSLNSNFSSLNNTIPPSYTFTNEGEIFWFFADDKSNITISQSQQIHLLSDTIAPNAMCYDSVTISLDSMGMATILPARLDSLSSDNCSDTSDLVFSVDISSVVCDSLNKTFPVYLYVEDEVGKRDTCMSMVTIIDDLAPIFLNVPDSLYLSCADDIPNQEPLSVVENCGMIATMYMDTISTRADTSATVTFADLARDSATYYNYDITYIWHAVDTVGNKATVQQVIQVRDTTAPTFNLDTLYLVPTSDNSTTCSGTITLDLLGNISDQCSDTLKYLAIAGADRVVVHDTLEMITLNVDMGDTTIYVIAEDFSNNRDTHKIRIVVDDMTEPVPRCNNSVAVTINAFGFAAIDSSVINLNSIDNCTSPGNLRFELSQDTFRCPDIGQTITIFMNVIDEAGNSAPCQSNVTVNDFAGTGSFACPVDVTINCDASIDPDSTGFPSLMDVCGGGSGLEMSDKVIAGPGGTGNICQIIERTWTFTDSVSGTVTTCLQRINLVDEIAPVLAESFNDTIVACIMDADTRDSILATDNCVDDAYVYAVDSFTMGMDTITLRRIWTAFDSCTITADTQYIKIVDNLAPLVNLPADTVFNTGDFSPDSCGVFVNIDFTPYITDCNASLGLSIGYEVQDSSFKDTTVLTQYFPIGEHRVIVTARDSSNNIGRDTIIIDVNDTSTPTVVCVENIVVSLGSGGTGVLEVADVLIRASDNCGGTLSDTLATLSQTIFDCSDLGLKEIALTVTDTSGNVGVCMVNVTVVNQGNTDFISITTDSLDESLTGLNDGQASVTVTGGSGNYTVQWDDPTNATTDTISNLMPGLYTVTVNDASTGCRLTDTIRVNAGSTISYVIGEVSGAPGTVVQVPISVTNFINVTNIDMALTISDPNVGQFIPNNLAGGFNNVTIDIDDFIIDTNDPNRLRIVPRLADNNGETVPDGTVIFYVNILISANASINDMTMITAAGDEVADIKTGLVIGGSAMELTSTSTIGKVTVIDPGVGVVNVGGKINLINGDPLFDATVMISGDVTSQDSTKADGTYNVMVNEGQSITITPTENENARNGLSTFDLVLIQDHINGRLLDSPYKRLAADINKSGSITIFDIIEIQDVILRRITSFTAVPSWTFVPADHTFTDQANPWGGTVPTSITTTASAADSALNFIAIKTGDVSLDADEVRFQGNVAAKDRNKDFAFKVTDQLVEAGTYVEIPFRADNFDQMRGYQMTLDVATEWLTFESVKPGALTDISKNNFSLTNIAKGQIATNWFNNAAKTVDATETLFTLVFKVEKTGRPLSELLQITSDMIQAEAYTDELFYNGIDLVFEDQSAVAETYELFQNKPNPFRNETTVSFNLPEKAPVTLRFFDFSGRLTYEVKGNYAQGMNNITISKNDLATNGVLYYELSTPGFTARKKMIVLE